MAIKNEELKALFPDLEISEDTILKIKIMVENAVAEKTKTALAESATAIEAAQASIATITEQAEQELASVVADMTEKAEAYAEYVVKEMTEKVDAYAEYVVERFITDNADALKEGIEYGRMQRVFESIKSAFETASYELTDVKVVEDAASEAALTEAKSTCNKLFNENQQLVKENTEMQFAMVFESMTRDLADTQKEKLNALIENVTFDGVAEFKRGVELMIAQLTENSAPVEPEVTPVEPEVDPVVEPEVTPVDESSKPSSMSRYLNVL